MRWSPLEFRLRRRDYGVLIPPGEVSQHLAEGWRLIDDEEVPNGVLMTPPARRDFVVMSESPADFATWGPPQVIFESAMCGGFSRPFVRGAP